MMEQEVKIRVTPTFSKVKELEIVGRIRNKRQCVTAFVLLFRHILASPDIFHSSDTQSQFFNLKNCYSADKRTVASLILTIQHKLFSEKTY